MIKTNSGANGKSQSKENKMKKVILKIETEKSSAECLFNRNKIKNKTTYSFIKILDLEEGTEEDIINWIKSGIMNQTTYDKVKPCFSNNYQNLEKRILIYKIGE